MIHPGVQRICSWSVSALYLILSQTMRDEWSSPHRLYSRRRDTFEDVRKMELLPSPLHSASVSSWAIRPFTRFLEAPPDFFHALFRAVVPIPPESLRFSHLVLESNVCFSACSLGTRGGGGVTSCWDSARLVWWYGSELDPWCILSGVCWESGSLSKSPPTELSSSKAPIIVSVVFHIQSGSYKLPGSYAGYTHGFSQ